jgi:hypothetical protein
MRPIYGSPDKSISEYADSALQLYPALMDYNTVGRQSFLPFTGLNEEVLYQSNFFNLYAGAGGLCVPELCDRLHAVPGAGGVCGTGGQDQGCAGRPEYTFSKALAAEGLYPCHGPTPSAALDLILAKRRKELSLRGLRWTDLLRLGGQEHYGDPDVEWRAVRAVAQQPALCPLMYSPLIQI